ncbi:PEP-CTERM sorting domain-containing protein [Zooshikella sp. RANM57]|uniref:PEP-CTERM sorting domain-containing protein n=1 Tax=Zooshikella sp. RANM57 TaxID=3425863 RepID=UPI003D6E5A9B
MKKIRYNLAYSILAFFVLPSGSLLSTQVQADVISKSNGNITQNSLGNHNRNPKQGTYRLKAIAEVTPPVNSPDQGPINPNYTAVPAPTPGTPNPSNSDNLSNTDSEQRLKADSDAKIQYNNAIWTSKGSTATVTLVNTPKNVDESGKARAEVSDPWFWEAIDVDESIMFTETWEAGTSITAFNDEGGEASASLQANFSTDLDDLGELWRFSWSTDAKTPGVSLLDIVTNPILGLNDLLLETNFLSLVSSDPLTGVSTLTADFSFSYSLIIPANETPTWTGDHILEATATTIPEPSTYTLLLLSALCTNYLRRKKKTPILAA